MAESSLETQQECLRIKQDDKRASSRNSSGYVRKSRAISAAQRARERQRPTYQVDAANRR